MTARIVTGQARAWRLPARPVMTIGMFDGMHLAHRALIRRTIAEAARKHGASVVLTFNPDPHRVLDPAHAQPALMPHKARIQALAESGVDAVIVMRFTRAFARMTATRFIERVLQQQAHAAAIVVGDGFMFGRGRHGNMTLLQRAGPAHGLQVIALPHVLRGGSPVSSSRIRRAIATGALATARRLLGRDAELYGRVVHGAGRGRRFGVPTVNLRLLSEVVPPHGVYAVLVHASGHLRPWRGVMNLGTRPTFGAGPVVAEIHVLGFRGRFTPRTVRVSLRARLRNERCFPSIDALYRQIRRDIARTKRLLAS